MLFASAARVGRGKTPTPKGATHKVNVHSLECIYDQSLNIDSSKKKKKNIGLSINITNEINCKLSQCLPMDTRI